MKDNNTRCCGNCRHFTDEDAGGHGWCTANDTPSVCSSACDRQYRYRALCPEPQAVR